MECTSDTESDSSGPVPSASKECATFHQANTALDIGLSFFGAVGSAIETLSERDVPSVLEDQPRFQRVSELLLKFLDRVPDFMNADQVSGVIEIFARLGTHYFLQRLLDLRKYVRLIERAPGSQSIVVTWVDVFLAKLSLLATPIAVSLAAYDIEKEAEWIQLRREEDTIRATTQLPDHWKAMVAVIGSSNFSPAARRLATSLCFIAYIMARKMISDKTWPGEGPPPVDVLHSLYPSINHAACTSLSPSVQNTSSVEKVQLAMLVSFFADAHSHTEPGDLTYTSHFRPEGFGHILQIIQIILGQSSSSLRVLEKPDPAQYILLRWGNFVPWSWSTWNDQRVANTECLRSLSATWFLLHSPMQGTRHQLLDQRIFGIDLQCVLLSDVFSSSLMVLQLMKEILDDRNRNLIPRSTASRILCKLCWASVQYLEGNTLKSNSQFEVLIPELCSSLILLFPVVKVHDEKDNFVRFLIVEALALIPTEVISSSLKKILQNKHFLANLDELIRSFIRPFSDQVGEKRDQDVQIYFAKSLLNMSSLLLQSTIDDPNLQGTISSFVVYVSESMLRGDNPSLNKIILGPFLTVLSALRSRKSETIRISDKDIWSLTTKSLDQHLSIPTAFAYYLLTTSTYHRDPLLRHEAWNYLLGALTKILERQLPAEEEPLGLLISCSICLSLRSIILWSGTTRKCLLASPWTLILRLSLEELLESETRNEPYFKQLKERIRLEGIKLVNELSDKGTKQDDVCVSLRKRFLAEVLIRRRRWKEDPGWFITATVLSRS